MNVAIIMAGGIGKRMNAEKPKQFLPLRGKPVILHSLETFQKCPMIDAIAVVCAEGYIGVCKKLTEENNITKCVSVVPGGAERYDSSRIGVAEASKIADGTDAVVLIHDAARPFVTEEIIAANITAAEKFGACETAIEMTDTVISGKDGFTEKVVPRESLYRVQTPQSFRLSVIREAFDSYDPETDGPVTDDATLVLRRGGRVAIVKGSAANVKITTPEDLR
ncbi:MAG: 2-C-methyl-D-erythritol 4-phosphate cytidylyltransferase [Clostridia bacterium]|nr:2-C-methyl-D-erythritol 4-phosphate cytidylyltransferase [Clostridia bacterium]